MMAGRQSSPETITNPSPSPLEKIYKGWDSCSAVTPETPLIALDIEL
jgi:hypothetical protein